MQDENITVEDYKRHRDSLTDVNNIQDQMHKRLDLKIEEVQNQITFEVAIHRQRLSHLQATLEAFQETSIGIEKFQESVQSRHAVLKDLDDEPRPELKPVSRFTPNSTGDVHLDVDAEIEAEIEKAYGS